MTVPYRLTRSAAADLRGIFRHTLARVDAETGTYPFLAQARCLA